MVQNKETNKQKSFDVSESSHCISSFFKGGFVSVGQRVFGGISMCFVTQRWFGIKDRARGERWSMWKQPRAHTVPVLVQGFESLFAAAHSRARLAEIKETTLDIPVNTKHLLKGQDEVFSHTSKTFLCHLTLCCTSCPPPAGTNPGQCDETTHGVTRANNTANTHRSTAPAAQAPVSQHKRTRKSVAP